MRQCQGGLAGPAGAADGRGAEPVASRSWKDRDRMSPGGTHGDPFSKVTLDLRPPGVPVTLPAVSHQVRCHSSPGSLSRTHLGKDAPSQLRGAREPPWSVLLSV